ncbi:hypothetical protein BC628DRAFT_1149793 [Trametes gibbosa]|nr:hypothetical protein BC628DRAFT_1149793 [Trametes gibbosa]
MTFTTSQLPRIKNQTHARVYLHSVRECHDRTETRRSWITTSRRRSALICQIKARLASTREAQNYTHQERPSPPSHISHQPFLPLMVHVPSRATPQRSRIRRSVAGKVPQAAPNPGHPCLLTTTRLNPVFPVYAPGAPYHITLSKPGITPRPMSKA